MEAASSNNMGPPPPPAPSLPSAVPMSNIATPRGGAQMGITYPYPYTANPVKGTPAIPKARVSRTPFNPTATVEMDEEAKEAQKRSMKETKEAAQKKRKEVRAAATASKRKVPLDDNLAAPKRGRPKMTEPEGETELSRGRSPKKSAEVVKRPRGRPSKKPEPEAEVVKRPRGRPSKKPEPEAEVVKRPRGRPSKAPADAKPSAAPKRSRAPARPSAAPAKPSSAPSKPTAAPAMLAIRDRSRSRGAGPDAAPIVPDQELKPIRNTTPKPNAAAVAKALGKASMPGVVKESNRRNKGIPAAGPQKAPLIKTVSIVPASGGAGVLKKNKKTTRNRGPPALDVIEALKA
jgi:hypothetical protein